MTMSAPRERIFSYVSSPVAASPTTSRPSAAQSTLPRTRAAT